MCDKKDCCKYGNNINRYCNSCIKAYEGVRYYPANATNKFSEGVPIKLVLFSKASMEESRAKFANECREDDFYREFYNWILEQEHFEQKAVRFDG